MKNKIELFGIIAIIAIIGLSIGACDNGTTDSNTTIPEEFRGTWEWICSNPGSVHGVGGTHKITLVIGTSTINRTDVENGSSNTSAFNIISVTEGSGSPWKTYTINIQGGTSMAIELNTAVSPPNEFRSNDGSHDLPRVFDKQ